MQHRNPDFTGDGNNNSRRLTLRHALLPALASLLFVAAAAAETPDSALRDPFWPLGYEPKKPEPEKPPEALEPVPEKTAPPPAPAKPVLQPVTEREWEEALKSLSISGRIRSTRPDTGETRVQMMINRQTYGAGDIVCVTNHNTAFFWQLENTAAQDLVLKQAKATRLQPAAKQTNKQ
ncbi:MAG: hypothetical protein PHU80_02555 [Kiritimatiellae bacterium]|nr:hypothetical protein [Kiritimatiellia bacterium]